MMSRNGISYLLTRSFPALEFFCWFVFFNLPRLLGTRKELEVKREPYIERMRSPLAAGLGLQTFSC